MRRNGEDRQSFAFMEVMTGVFVASNRGHKRRRLWRLYWEVPRSSRDGNDVHCALGLSLPGAGDGRVGWIPRQWKMVACFHSPSGNPITL